ncbi:hypothetical protein D3C80_1198710 [compost metagenome]
MAILLADLGVQGTDAGIAKHQLVAPVLADGEALLDQPDGRLAAVLEVQFEHMCLETCPVCAAVIPAAPCQLPNRLFHTRLIGLAVLSAVLGAAPGASWRGAGRLAAVRRDARADATRA